MNPHCLLFWFVFWFFGYPAHSSVFKILDRKNKGIAEEGLHIEAYTHLQHWDLMLECVFPSSHTVRRQSIKRGEPRQMPSLPHTAESTVREEHFSSRRVSAHLSLGARGVLWGAEKPGRWLAKPHTVKTLVFYHCSILLDKVRLWQVQL